MILDWVSFWNDLTEGKPCLHGKCVPEIEMCAKPEITMAPAQFFSIPCYITMIRTFSLCHTISKYNNISKLNDAREALKKLLSYESLKKIGHLSQQRTVTEIVQQSRSHCYTTASSIEAWQDEHAFFNTVQF